MSAERDLLPAGAVAALSQAYDTGRWVEWRRTPKGSANVSFFVTATSGRYVLRRSGARKSRAALEFEVAVIDYLRRCGYPAPEVIRTRAGRGYAEHDGALYLLTRFIPGDPYDPDDARHLAAAGRGLALYHRLARRFPGWPLRLGPLSLAALGCAGPARLAEAAGLARPLLEPGERPRFDEACAYLRAQFATVHRELAARSRALDRLVIHGSFGRSALIFAGERLAGVVDYDRAAYELRGLDLAYTAKAFCRVHDRARPDYRIGLDYDRCRALMAAYREVERLSPETAGALPVVLRAQRLRKVLTKCANFVTKHAAAPQGPKDARKLATMAAREGARLSWLERNGRPLAEALAG
ncbi:MAG TPA: phosphotransferase [Thermodesulfobacteriota bacterium]|nr:phosphotransferase [Thermodesulfobacteriota bacterium]